ncbi:MAG: ABC transporter substrate-binding protein [Bdellovibrionota bacterium]
MSKNEIQETIKIFQPESIFVAGEPAYAVKVIQLLRSLNYNKPIVGSDSFDSKDVESLKGGDIYYTTHAFVNTETADPIVQIFIKDYVEKFHSEPDGSFAALGFDTVYLLARAVNIAQSTSASKVAEALHKIKNHHLVTGNITFVEKSNIPEKSLSIIKLGNEKKSVAAVVE